MAKNFCLHPFLMLNLICAAGIIIEDHLDLLQPLLGDKAYVLLTVGVGVLNLFLRMSMMQPQGMQHQRPEERQPRARRLKRKAKPRPDDDEFIVD